MSGGEKIKSIISIEDWYGNEFDLHVETWSEMVLNATWYGHVFYTKVCYDLHLWPCEHILRIRDIRWTYDRHHIDVRTDTNIIYYIL